MRAAISTGSILLEKDPARDVGRFLAERRESAPSIDLRRIRIQRNADTLCVSTPPVEAAVEIRGRRMSVSVERSALLAEDNLPSDHATAFEYPSGRHLR